MFETAENKQKVIVMVGLQGSGKSAKAQKLGTDGNYIIISSDDIRVELHNDGVSFTNETVFNTYYERFRNALKEGRNVILDATNTTLKARRCVFENVKRTHVQRKSLRIVAYIVNTTLEDCVKRLASRQRESFLDADDWTPVLDKYQKSFQIPMFYEGFDEIVLDNAPENLTYDVSFCNELIKKMSDFDQKNPHHIHSLYVHSKNLAYSYAKDFISNRIQYKDWIILSSAALWHDVGKLFTQTFDEEGVAHYYGHDGVGTYYVLSHPELFGGANTNSFLESLFYINFHMKAHRDFKNPKAEAKYRALFGDERYDSLIQFATYDKIASGTYKFEVNK